METGRSNRDYYSEMARGNVADKELRTILGNNTALNPMRAVWDEPQDYVFPSVAATFSVKSSDVADTLAGTGAQKVRVTYLDANFVEKTEDLDMDGTTLVPLSETAMRVNSLSVIQVGSGGKNVGKISIEDAGNVLYIIRVGENNSDGCIYSVPAGKEAIIYAPSSAVSSGTEADVFIEFRQGPNAPMILRKAYSVFESSNPGELSKPVLFLPEKSDFIVLAEKILGPNPKISVAFQIEIHDEGQ